jgi:hypothetical protein
MAKRFEGRVNERTSQTDLDYIFDQTLSLEYYNRVLVTLMYSTVHVDSFSALTYVDIFTLNF